MPDGSGKPIVMDRFDDSWESYDPADLAIIRSPNKIFAEDQAAEFGGASLFFARQLDYVKSRVYNRKFPDINPDLLVPDSTDTPEWAETISVQSYDSVGMAKIIANYADDLPRVDVRAMVQLVPVKTLGDSYGYNVNEIRASRAIGAGLDVRKAEAARRAIDLKIARIKMIGDDDYGLFGLFNYPNILEIIFGAGGPPGTTTGNWDTLTGEQIYLNMNAMMFAFMQQTLGVHRANFMAMAPTAYNAASTRFFNNQANPFPSTALDLFRRMHPGVRVENIIECQGAGTGANLGRDVIFLYELNSENLAHEYVMPFTQLPPEARNLEFVTNCLARSGGVHIYYPLAFLKGHTST